MARVPEPRSATPALVDGAHALDVGAISPSGKEAPTPAHRSWTVDTIAPKATAHGSWGAVVRDAASKTYSVGGTVSGLSGSVVLQDNGGDDLSVSGTGAVHVRDSAGGRALPIR